MSQDQSPLDSALAEGWAAYQASLREEATDSVPEQLKQDLPVRPAKQVWKPNEAMEQARAYVREVTTEMEAAYGLDTLRLDSIVRRFLKVSPAGVLQKANMGEYLFVNSIGFLNFEVTGDTQLVMLLNGRPTVLQRGAHNEQILGSEQLNEFYNLVSHYIEDQMNFGRTGDFLETRAIPYTPDEWLDLRYTAAGRPVPDRALWPGRPLRGSAKSPTSPPEITFDEEGFQLINGQRISSSFAPLETWHTSWISTSAVGLPIVLPPSPSGIARLTLT